MVAGKGTACAPLLTPLACVAVSEDSEDDAGHEDSTEERDDGWWRQRRKGGAFRRHLSITIYLPLHGQVWAGGCARVFQDREVVLCARRVTEGHVIKTREGAGLACRRPAYKTREPVPGFRFFDGGQ